MVQLLATSTDCEDVNDSIINFASIIKEVVLDQFHLVLPPTFTMSKAKTSKTEEQPKTKKPKKNNENKTPKDGDAKKVVNKNVPIKFHLLENKD